MQNFNTSHTFLLPPYLYPMIPNHEHQKTSGFCSEAIHKGTPIDCGCKFAIYNRINYICIAIFINTSHQFANQNRMELVNRLKFFMEHENIAISQFADTCKIPRPTMSQILNGRNKKISDELISKIHIAYPNLSVLWLMFGEGEMTINPNIQISEPPNSIQTTLFDSKSPSDQHDASPYSQIELTSEKSTENSMSQTKELNTFDFTHNTPNHIAENPNKEAYPLSENTFIDFVPQSYSEKDKQAHASFNPDIQNNENDVNNNSAVNTNITNRPQPREEPNNITRQSFTPNSPTSQTNTATDNLRNVSIKTNPTKTITNIVVFYSDNSFQSFYPTI